MIALRLVGLVLWGSVIAFMINPASMTMVVAAADGGTALERRRAGRADGRCS